MNKNNKWLKGHDMLKVARAITLWETAPLEQVVQYTGVEHDVLQYGARLLHREYLLDDTGKPDLIPSKYYSDILDDVRPEEVADSQDATLQNVLNRVQGECDHAKFFCRCSRCMKVVGSELNHFHIEKVIQMIMDVESDLQEPHDEDGNLVRKELCLVLTDRLYKKVITDIEDEEFDGI